MCGNLSFAGAQRQLYELAKNLDRRKYKVFLCSISDDVQIYEAINSIDVQLFVLGRRYRHLYKIVVDVVKILRNNAIDVIYPFMFEANLVARLAGVIARTPVVLSSERSSNYKSRTFELCAEISTRSLYDIVITNSFAGQAFLVNNRKIKKSRIEVIWNGINPEKYHENIEIRDSIRSELKIPNDGIVIGMISRIKPAKNFKMFFHVANELIHQYKRVYFLSVGDYSFGQQEYFDSIMEYCRELNIEESRLHFAGKRLDVPDMLSAIDISILTSVREGFPNAVLESMAAGIPVVATDVGDIPLIIDNGYNGYVVHVNDTDEMVSKLKVLIDDSDLRNSMGKHGRKKVLKEFSITKMVEKTDLLITELLRKKVRTR